MIGLMLKDFYSLRSYLVRQTAIIAMVYVVLCITMRSTTMLTPMLVMYMMMLLISSFSVDEAAHWNGYALTLPVTREILVRAKYFLFFGGMVLACVLSAVFSILLNGLFFHESIIMILVSAAVILYLYMLVCAVVLPLFIKLGPEKARLWMTVLFMAPFLLIVMGTQYLSSIHVEMPEPSALMIWIVPCILALLVVIYASYCIAVRLLEKKEF